MLMKKYSYINFQVFLKKCLITYTTNLKQTFLIHNIYFFKFLF